VLLKTTRTIIKPPPGARVDLSHPLGRKCQAAILFNDGTHGQEPKVAGATIANTYIDCPQVQWYQTQALRVPRLFYTLSAIPIWTYNSHGKAIWFAGNGGGGGGATGMDVGFVLDCESYDLDYPEFAAGATVTRGQTVCIIRRKTDTTARQSTLFGVEDFSLSNSVRCGAHVPYSDGTVYWDYGGASGSNRLTVASLTFTTNVEKWIFTAGPQGSTIWRDGLKLASQSTAITRVVTTQASHAGGWVLNGGNGHITTQSSDNQEYNFVMYLATQWSDAQCEWWFGEPYAAFEQSFMTRSYQFFSTVAAPRRFRLVCPP
jgi:hypothetical protein